MARVLAELGFESDPEMAHTAERFTAFLTDWRGADDLPVPSLFDVEDSGLVVIRDIPYHSLCAHHLLPFFGHATVGYLPGRQVAGLGSVARLVHHFAHRPQLQERMGAQVADALLETVGARAAVVRLTARQMCMEMRGVASQGTVEVLTERGEATDVARLLAAL